MDDLVVFGKDDAFDLLTELGLWGSVCHECDDAIHMDNVGVVVPLGGGAAEVYCSDDLCSIVGTYRLTELMQEAV